MHESGTYTLNLKSLVFLSLVLGVWGCDNAGGSTSADGGNTAGEAGSVGDAGGQAGSVGDAGRGTGFRRGRYSDGLP